MHSILQSDLKSQSSAVAIWQSWPLSSQHVPMHNMTQSYPPATKSHHLHLVSLLPAVVSSRPRHSSHALQHPLVVLAGRYCYHDLSNSMYCLMFSKHPVECRAVLLKIARHCYLSEDFASSGNLPSANELDSTLNQLQNTMVRWLGRGY